MKKEAIILAGGLGTRLKSIVKTIPKSMILINSKPMLQYIIEKLYKENFDRIIISVGYLSKQILEYFGNNFQGMKIDYSIEDRPLGTGGALILASKLTTSPHFLVLNGDSFIDFDYNDIYKKWAKNKQVLIISTYMDDTSRYGAIVYQDEKVISFGEKNSSGPGFINAGVYMISKEILKNYSNLKVFSLEKDFLNVEVTNDSVYCYPTKCNFIDIGVPEDLEKASNFFRSLN